MIYKTNQKRYSQFTGRLHKINRLVLTSLLIMGTHLSCHDDDSGNDPSPDTPFTIKLVGIENSVVSVSAILENKQSVFKRDLVLLPDKSMACLTLEDVPTDLYQLRILINEGEENQGELTYEGNTSVNVTANSTLELSAPFYQDDCCVSIEWKGRYYYEHEDITGIFSSNPCENYVGLLDNCRPIGLVSYLYVDKFIYDQNGNIIQEAFFECFDCKADEENIVGNLEQFQYFHQICEDEEDWVVMDSMIMVDYGPEDDGVSFTSFYQKWKN